MDVRISDPSDLSKDVPPVTTTALLLNMIACPIDHCHDSPIISQKWRSVKFACGNVIFLQSFNCEIDEDLQSNTFIGQWP